MKNLEETSSTRDRPYSGGPRLTKPNEYREICPTHIENRFGGVLQTEGTKICAKIGFGYEEPSMVPSVITEDSAYSSNGAKPHRSIRV